MQRSFVQQARSVRRRTAGSVPWYIVASVAMFLACSSSNVYAQAEDKNGVAPTAISRPTGPGSLEGLGDAFQPALNTGTARYSVPFLLPEGVAGFTPTLSMQYDSGHGFGPVGIGWTCNPGDVRRQTDKGLPRYGEAPDGSYDPNRFLGMENEELVPLANGYFLAKIENHYIRYSRVGDHWEAHTKSGTKLEFGLAPSTRVADGKRIYRWCLEKQTDTNGNVIEYHYIRPSEEDRQVYLSEIRYGSGASPWAHYYSVRLTYEDRLDPFMDYRSGFRVNSAKRLAHVDIYFEDQLTRRYVLEYGADPHWSFLTRVTRFGDDPACQGATPDCALPSTTFAYDRFPALEGKTISAAGHVISSRNEPAHVMDLGSTELLDINADGLPDLLSTGTGHVAYLNRGVQDSVPTQRVLDWEGPLAIKAADPGVLAFDVSAPNVHLADLTGDAVADFVVTDTSLDEYFYYPNLGQAAWGNVRYISTGTLPPPVPFENESVETVDLDFDKLIDILQTRDGVLVAWFNRGGAEYSDPVFVEGVLYGNAAVDFGDPGVQLADVNGDRIQDIVKVTATGILFWPGIGYGRFDVMNELRLPLSDPGLDNGHIARAKLSDINGDGLADLMVERFDAPDSLRFWLNMGPGFDRDGDGVAEMGDSWKIVDLPPACATNCTRWADINGNGTTDFIVADSSLPESRIQAVDLGVLLAGTPHLNVLAEIDNGYGRQTQIEYGSSTEFFLRARDAGNPWDTTISFPVTVVKRTRTAIGLDLDGYPDEGSDGDVYITDYDYRDGYYDPLEKQFRGFGFVKQIQRGDERFSGDSAPTLLTRYRFHTGAPDGIDNDGDGVLDDADLWNGREEEPLKGVELWRETTALHDDPATDGEFSSNARVFERAEANWVVRSLSNPNDGAVAELLGESYRTADDPYGRRVRQAVRVSTRSAIIERQPDDTLHKTLETRTDVDPIGNTLFEWNLGDLSNPEDDLYSGYDYARNEPLWIMNRVTMTVQEAGGPGGPFVSETRNFYDGPPFQGLPLGEWGARGNLHRSETLISGGPVPPITERSFLRGDPRDPDGRVNTLRQRLDEFGNVVVALDANAQHTESGEPDGDGHERRMEYDSELHKFPVRETIVLGQGKPDLEVTATYDLRFGTPLSVTDFNGHASRFTYDSFGRLETEILPGDDPEQPTRRYDYDLGNPVSSITTIAHTKEGGSPDVVTTKFFDGLGRELGNFEHGGPVMSGVTMFNPRGQPFQVFQPFMGSPPADPKTWSLPGPEVPFATTRYDAAGRAI